ncbi:MAG: hypothetical protein ACE365_02520 [Gammaproteobacteria bacterium]
MNNSRKITLDQNQANHFRLLREILVPKQQGHLSYAWDVLTSTSSYITTGQYLGSAMRDKLAQLFGLSENPQFILAESEKFLKNIEEGCTFNTWTGCLDSGPSLGYEEIRLIGRRYSYLRFYAYLRDFLSESDIESELDQHHLKSFMHEYLIDVPEGLVSAIIDAAYSPREEVKSEEETPEGQSPLLAFKHAIVLMYRILNNADAAKIKNAMSDIPEDSAFCRGFSQWFSSQESVDDFAPINKGEFCLSLIAKVLGAQLDVEQLVPYAQRFFASPAAKVSFASVRDFESFRDVIELFVRGEYRDFLQNESYKSRFYALLASVCDELPSLTREQGFPIVRSINAIRDKEAFFHALSGKTREHQICFYSKMIDYTNHRSSDCLEQMESIINEHSFDELVAWVQLFFDDEMPSRPVNFGGVREPTNDSTHLSHPRSLADVLAAVILCHIDQHNYQDYAENARFSWAVFQINLIAAYPEWPRKLSAEGRARMLSDFSFFPVDVDEASRLQKTNDLLQLLNRDALNLYLVLDREARRSQGYYLPSMLKVYDRLASYSKDNFQLYLEDHNTFETNDTPCKFNLLLMAYIQGKANISQLHSYVGSEREYMASKEKGGFEARLLDYNYLARRSMKNNTSVVTKFQNREECLRWVSFIALDHLISAHVKQKPNKDAVFREMEAVNRLHFMSDNPLTLRDVLNQISSPLQTWNKCVEEEKELEEEAKASEAPSRLIYASDDDIEHLKFKLIAESVFYKNDDWRHYEQDVEKLFSKVNAASKSVFQWLCGGMKYRQANEAFQAPIDPKLQEVFEIVAQTNPAYGHLREFLFSDLCGEKASYFFMLYKDYGPALPPESSLMDEEKGTIACGSNRHLPGLAMYLLNYVIVAQEASAGFTMFSGTSRMPTTYEELQTVLNESLPDASEDEKLLFLAKAVDLVKDQLISIRDSEQRESGIADKDTIGARILEVLCPILVKKGGEFTRFLANWKKAKLFERSAYRLAQEMQSQRDVNNEERGVELHVK